MVDGVANAATRQNRSLFPLPTWQNGPLHSTFPPTWQNGPLDSTLPPTWQNGPLHSTFPPTVTTFALYIQAAAQMWVMCNMCNLLLSCAFDAVGWVAGGHPACKKLSGGVLAQRSWCHCHSLSLASAKSRLVLPCWYRLILEKGPLKGVCVCVVLFLRTYFVFACTSNFDEVKMWYSGIRLG